MFRCVNNTEKTMQKKIVFDSFEKITRREKPMELLRKGKKPDFSNYLQRSYFAMLLPNCATKALKYYCNKLQGYGGNLASGFRQYGIFASAKRRSAKIFTPNKSICRSNVRFTQLLLVVFVSAKKNGDVLRGHIQLRLEDK